MRIAKGAGATVAGLVVAVATLVGPSGAVTRVVSTPGPRGDLAPFRHGAARHRTTTVAPLLCPMTGRVTSVTATRSTPLNPETFSFPRVTEGTDPTAVRRAARALCALPVMPDRVQACPVDLGVRYTLRFSRGGGAAHLPRPVIVSAWGCRAVTGLGPTRVVTRAAVWTVIGAALGLRSATNATFAGRLTR